MAIEAMLKATEDHLAVNESERRVWKQRIVACVRFRYQIPNGPRLAVTGEGIYTAQEAARLLGVTHTTVIRWIELGLLKGEQLTSGAPWRVRVAEADRARLIADQAPAGWVSIKAAARALKVSGQTVLNNLKEGKLQGVLVRTGRQPVWKIRVPTATSDRQHPLFT